MGVADAFGVVKGWGDSCTREAPVVGETSGGGDVRVSAKVGERNEGCCGFGSDGVGTGEEAEGLLICKRKLDLRFILSGLICKLITDERK